MVSLDPDTRRRIIASALECGLHVHGEVGSKSEGSGASALIADATACLAAGADVVLVEAAELADDAGTPKRELIGALADGLDLERTIFELGGPWLAGVQACDVYQLKVLLVKTFGPDVNLANVMPDQIFETEALRCGLSVPGPPKRLN